MQGRTVTVALPPTVDGGVAVDNFAPPCGAGPVTVFMDGNGAHRADGSIDGAVGQLDLVPAGGSTALRGLAPGADGQTIRVRNACAPGDDGSITLDNLAATSFPAWQFQCTRDGTDLGPGEVITLVYRADLGKWVIS